MNYYSWGPSSSKVGLLIGRGGDLIGTKFAEAAFEEGEEGHGLVQSVFFLFFDKSQTTSGKLTSLSGILGGAVVLMMGLQYLLHCDGPDVLAVV